MERKDGIEDPETILKRRLASGEIGRAEYDEIRRHVVRQGTTGGGGSLSQTGLALVISLSVVLAIAITYVVLAYGPWGPGGGMMGWGDGDMHDNDEVLIYSSGFSPQELTVPVGTTVTWYNMAGGTHTVYFDEEHASMMGDMMGSGHMGHMGGWSYTFEEPGVFEYHCESYPNMTGTVIVEG